MRGWRGANKGAIILFGICLYSVPLSQHPPLLLNLPVPPPLKFPNLQANKEPLDGVGPFSSRAQTGKRSNIAGPLSQECPDRRRSVFMASENRFPDSMYLFILKERSSSSSDSIIVTMRDNKQIEGISGESFGGTGNCDVKTYFCLLKSHSNTIYVSCEAIFIFKFPSDSVQRQNNLLLILLFFLSLLQRGETHASRVWGLRS